MPMNKKNKIIIVSLAFLILVVLMFWDTLFILVSWKYDERMSVWDFLTARPVPSSITQYPTPAPPGPIPSNLPPIVQGPSPDTRTWGQLLRSPIAEIPGITWKTLRNNEYGFEMKYPSNWTYKMKRSINTVGSESYPVFSINFSSEVFLIIQKRSLNSYEKYIGQKEFSAKEILSINAINWALIDANVGSVILQLYTEKQGYVYSFSDDLTTQNYNVDAYMIKSFHFVQ